MMGLAELQEAPEDLHGLGPGMNGQREMLRSGSSRPRVRGWTRSSTRLDSLCLLRSKSLEEIQKITFEIGMLGRYTAAQQTKHIS